MVRGLRDTKVFCPRSEGMRVFLGDLWKVYVWGLASIVFSSRPVFETDLEKPLKEQRRGSPGRVFIMKTTTPPFMYL